MLSGLISPLVNLYSWVIFARLIISWFPNVDYRHPAVRFLIQITDPVLAPARRIIPPFGGMDFSPIIVFLVLPYLGDILASILRSLGL